MQGQLTRLLSFNYVQNYSRLNGKFFTLGILKKKQRVYLFLITETEFKGTDSIWQCAKLYLGF